MSREMTEGQHIIGHKVCHERNFSGKCRGDEIVYCFMNRQCNDIDAQVKDSHIDQGSASANKGEQEEALAPARTPICYSIDQIKQAINKGPGSWTVTW